MVGVDIVAISRIERLLEKNGEKFVQRVLNKEESLLAKSAQSIAGFWAAKEAISKALGCGIGSELSFLDIQIGKKASGQPFFELPKDIVSKYKIKQTSLSISHDGGFAIAVVAIESDYFDKTNPD